MSRIRKSKKKNVVQKSRSMQKRRAKANRKIAIRKNAKDGCTGKSSFDTKQEAVEKASKNLRDNERIASIRPGFKQIKKLAIYLCRKCGLFHLSKSTTGEALVVVSLEINPEL
jgi:hypothetical protein